MENNIKKETSFRKRLDSLKKDFDVITKNIVISEEEKTKKYLQDRTEEKVAELKKKLISYDQKIQSLKFFEFVHDTSIPFLILNQKIIKDKLYSFLKNRYEKEMTKLEKIKTAWKFNFSNSFVTAEKEDKIKKIEKIINCIEALQSTKLSRIVFIEQEFSNDWKLSFRDNESSYFNFILQDYLLYDFLFSKID